MRVVSPASSFLYCQACSFRNGPRCALDLAWVFGRDRHRQHDDRRSYVDSLVDALEFVERAVCSFRRSSRSEEHTSELQSHLNLVCRLLLEKKKTGNMLALEDSLYAHANDQYIPQRELRKSGPFDHLHHWHCTTHPEHNLQNAILAAAEP